MTAVMFQAVFDAGAVWLWILIYILDLLYFASMAVRFVMGYKKREFTTEGYFSSAFPTLLPIAWCSWLKLEKMEDGN